MPSISTQYSPFESLIFLQSIARNGADSSALSTISRSLNSNQFVTNSANYDANRLAPEALKSLFDGLAKAEEDVTSLPVSGDNVGEAIDMRKPNLPVSLASPGRVASEAAKASHMVDRFYARYKERMIQEIKDEEKEYQALVAGIQTLEDGTNGEKKLDEALMNQGGSAGSQLPASIGNDSVPPQKAADFPTASPGRDKTPSRAEASQEDHAQIAERQPPHPSSGQMLPPQTPGFESSFPRSPSATAASQQQPARSPRSSPAPPNVVPVRGQHQLPGFPPRYAPMQPPMPLPHTTSPRMSNTLPPISSIVAQPPLPPPLPPPPPSKAAPTPRKLSGSAPSRTSPLLPSPPYQQQPPYGYPYAAWQQYHSPNSPYANLQYYHQPPMPPAHTPLYNQYLPYPHQAPPNHYVPAPYARPPLPGPPLPYARVSWPAQPASVSTTPSVKHSAGRPGIRTSGTSTPWTPGGIRLGSPERPLRERDVSPLSDRAASPEQAVKEPDQTQPTTIPQERPQKRVPKRGRGRGLRGARAGSTHSSALASRSRSQSLASATSENRPDRANDVKASALKIKHEAPSTPAPLTSDSEQRSSGRRRGRSDALQAPPADVGRSINKRKRESGTEASLSPSLPASRGCGSRIRPRPEPVDPSLVAVTKNFARMAAPILNDVNAHKLAGIFAKPLTERDAPGYKDLIYRPQDLKSIRAAVGRGSRAANAVIDELEATKADGEEAGSPATVVKATTTTTTPSGSILVEKTEELTPPKGIVNSAQLEMEFMRIFANAVMFNPLPPSERGLPAELKMGRDGSSSSSRQQQRSQRAKAESKDRGWYGGDDGGGVDEGEGEKKGYAQEEEGGIIHDTREIFASVEKSVQRWRSVEQGYIDDVPRNGAGVGVGVGLGLGLGLRGGSVSMSDAVAEESAQEEGDLPVGVGSGMGTLRKRRRLME